MDLWEGDVKEPILKPQVKITIENGSAASITLGVDFFLKKRLKNVPSKHTFN